VLYEVGIGAACREERLRGVVSGHVRPPIVCAAGLLSVLDDGEWLLSRLLRYRVVERRLSIVLG